MIFHLYGLCIGIGIWVGLFLAGKAQKRLAKYDKDYLKIDLDNVLLWVLVPGIIGARLYHVIDLWSYYIVSPVEALMLWKGGLGIYGGLAGGLVGLLIYLNVSKNRSKLTHVLDIIAFALPVAQAIGRMGNFFNQELFGLPTNLPWGIWIEPSNRSGTYVSASHFHPLFAYEAILNLALFGVMWRILQKKKNPGVFFAVYLTGYGIIRFLLDYLRIDPWRIGILTTAQWISCLLVLFGTYLFIRSSKRAAEL